MFHSKTNDTIKKRKIIKNKIHISEAASTPFNCLKAFTTVPDSLCLTVLKKFADLFAEFLLIFLQILQFFRALGPSGTWAGPGAVPPPKRLQNLQIKISRNSANKSANFFKAVRHRLSGTVVKMLRLWRSARFLPAAQVLPVQQTN